MEIGEIAAMDPVFQYAVINWIYQGGLLIVVPSKHLIEWRPHKKPA